jgi:hypothetical protein
MYQIPNDRDTHNVIAQGHCRLPHRFSLTKYCSHKKLMMVKLQKMMANITISGNQKDCGRCQVIEVRVYDDVQLTWARKPNTLRMAAAGTSNSTPYYFRFRDNSELRIGSSLP